MQTSHHVSECKNNCTYSACANSPPHPAKDCFNRKSNKYKQPSSISPSPPPKSPAIRGPPKVNQIVTTSPVPPPVPPVDTEVIFDCGSGVTTIPTSNYLSRTSQMMIHPLNAINADGSLHSSTGSGIFQGLPYHDLPSFQDILICLSDYLAQGRIAIVESTSMQIFNKNNSIDIDISKFCKQFLTDSILTVPVKDKIYSVPFTKFSTVPIIDNQSISSTVSLSSPFSPAYVVRNYETAHFTNKSQLVRFFHELFGRPSLTTMLSIISSESIVNVHPDLTPTAVRNFFPYDCPACPAGQLAQRHQASVEIIPHTLPGQAFEIDFKGPWTAPDGTHTRSLSNNLYTFTALDLVADYTFVACAPNCRAIIKHLQKLKTFAFRHTGNRICVLYSDTEFFTEPIHQWAASDDTSKIKLLLSIPYEHDRVCRVERLHRTLTNMANKQLAFKDHLSPKYSEFSYRHAADLRNIRPKKSMNGKSPYSIYHSSPYDLSNFSTFPFGSVVMAHLPLDLQTATSGRSDERYFVGIAHDFNSGIRLYCPIN